MICSYFTVRKEGGGSNGFKLTPRFELDSDVLYVLTAPTGTTVMNANDVLT